MKPTERAKILLVDDVATNIQLLNSLLGEEHETFFATRGEKALELARDKQPDLILLDVMMPEMDGHEVCRRLKSDPLTEAIPVIFVTAMGQESDEALGLKLGAVDYITKPLSAPIVQMRVRTHLELKQQRDLLLHLSLNDPLTGIANRRRFDEALTAEWSRCQRNGAPLALIMIDVDHFKAYNDLYGHLAGDECLRRVAAMLAERTGRPADLVARYGGEEFVALLPEIDREHALAMAERMRAAIHAAALPHAATDHGRVTVSLGVAAPHPSRDQHPEQLVERADRALYRAKEEGRNRARADDQP